MVTSAQNQPRVILTYRNENVKFYDYMFPDSISRQHYIELFGMEGKVKDSNTNGNGKYKLL